MLKFKSNVYLFSINSLFLQVKHFQCVHVSGISQWTLLWRKELGDTSAQPNSQWLLLLKQTSEIPQIHREHPSAAPTLLGHHVWFNGERSPMFIQVHHLQGLVGQRHTARGALVHVPTLDVEVQQDGMVVGVCEGESTRAVAVVDVGSVGTHQAPLQGDAEARQTAHARPHRVTGVCSGGPQSRLQLVLTGHRLQGLQEEERTELALSWREHEITWQKVCIRMCLNSSERTDTQNFYCVHHLLLVPLSAKRWALWASPASPLPGRPPASPLSPPVPVSQSALTSAWPPPPVQGTWPAARDAPESWSPVWGRRRRWQKRSWSVLPEGTHWKTNPVTEGAGRTRSPAGVDVTWAGYEASRHPGNVSAHRGRRRFLWKPWMNLKHVNKESQNKKNNIYEVHSDIILVNISVGNMKMKTTLYQFLFLLRKAEAEICWFYFLIFHQWGGLWGSALEWQETWGERRWNGTTKAWEDAISLISGEFVSTEILHFWWTVPSDAFPVSSMYCVSPETQADCKQQQENLVNIEREYIVCMYTISASLRIKQ